MKPRVSIITLAVDSLERAVAFYRDGMGLAPSNYVAGAEHASFELQEGLNLVLCPRRELQKLVEFEGRTDGGGDDLFATPSPSMILSYVAGTREEVTGILRDAEAAGGTLPKRPVDRFWGYTGYFRDPDGNLWEVVWYSQEAGPEE